MSTSNNGKSFEELLRQKLDGHEYEYHPSQWGKMQQKLHMHTHAASAAKSALMKKGLATAGKIGGGLIAIGAITYTILSLSGVIDRSDLGLGEKDKSTQVVVNIAASQEQKTDKTLSVVVTDSRSLTANETGSPNAAKSATGEQSASRRTEMGINAYNTHSGRITTRIKHGRDESAYDNSRDIARDSRNNSTSGNGAKELGEKNLMGNRDNSNLSSGNTDVSNNTGNNNVDPVAGKDAPKDNLSGDKTENLLTQKNDPKTEDTPTKNDSAADQGVNPLNPDNGRYNNQDKDIPFKVHAGITGGFSIVNLSGNSENNTTTSIGLNTIGAFVALPLNARITLQTGVSFRNQHDWNLHRYTTQVHYALKQDSTFTEFAITSGQYIDFPLLVKYTVGKNFILTGGVKVNWLQSVHGTLSQVSFENKALYNYDNHEINAAPEGFRRVDMNANIGVEYRFNKLFTAGAAYQYGLKNSLKNSAIIPGTLRNSYLQIYGAMRIF